MADIFSKFRTERRDHSNTNAYLCALLSYYSYEKAPHGEDTIPISYGSNFTRRLENFFQGLSDTDPLQMSAFSSSAGTEVFVFSNQQGIWVVFRGTDNIEEWISPNIGLGKFNAGRYANIAINMTKPPSSWNSPTPTRIHRGFYNALDSVYPELRNHVRALLGDKERPVFLTGHSRGGALATLCAYRFQVVGGVPVAGVYTFGAPRIGDGDGFPPNYGFSRSDSDGYFTLANRTFRGVYANDPATAIPLITGNAMIGLIAGAMVLAGPGGALISAPKLAIKFNSHYKRWIKARSRYTHVGQCRHYLSNGQVLTDLDRDYSPHLAESLFKAGILNKFSNWLDDHSMSNYLNATFKELSSRERLNESSPPYLVKTDVKTPLANISSS